MDDFEKALKEEAINRAVDHTNAGWTLYGKKLFMLGARWAREWIENNVKTKERLDWLSGVGKLRTENQRLREALEWYMNNCDCCSTDVATQALREVSE